MYLWTYACDVQLLQQLVLQTLPYPFEEVCNINVRMLGSSLLFHLIMETQLEPLIIEWSQEVNKMCSVLLSISVLKDSLVFYIEHKLN